MAPSPCERRARRRSRRRVGDKMRWVIRLSNMIVSRKRWRSCPELLNARPRALGIGPGLLSTADRSLEP